MHRSKLPCAVVHVDHRQPGKGLETLGMLGVGFGKSIVDDPAMLPRPRAVAALLDAPAGIGQHANVDAIPVHHV